MRRLRRAVRDPLFALILSAVVIGMICFNAYRITKLQDQTAAQAQQTQIEQQRRGPLIRCLQAAVHDAHLGQPVRDCPEGGVR